jgi:hypothetical protein
LLLPLKEQKAKRFFSKKLSFFERLERTKKLCLSSFKTLWVLRSSFNSKSFALSKKTFGFF